MNPFTSDQCIEALEDLLGYSGVDDSGDPIDTRSWNLALTAAKQLIQQRVQEKQAPSCWVKLTDRDKELAFDETQEASGGFWDFADYIEAILKSKNFHLKP
jgi:hypothetical protein